jgi:hypothetical protein
MAERSPKIVFQADNVVFAEIFAGLDFDEDQQVLAGVEDAVGRFLGDIHGLSRIQGDFFALQSNYRPSPDDHPVFGPLLVFLVAQPLSGKDFDPLYFVSLLLLKNFETTPGTFIHNFLSCLYSASNLTKGSVIRELIRHPFLSWVPGWLETAIKSPHPSFAKGRLGKFSGLRGCHASRRGRRNFDGMARETFSEFLPDHQGLSLHLWIY